MVLLNSVEQTRDTVTLFNSSFQDITENYINVIAQTVDIEDVTSESNHAIFQNQWLRSKLVPLTIIKSRENPSNAFVSVKYNNEWYYVDNADNRSKQTFGMLTYIYLLQSPRPQTAGPLVTVPTN